MPFCPRSSVRSERHLAKVEVAGASPAVDTSLPLCLSSHRTSFVNSHSSVRVRPEAPVYGDHDVTAASRPVKAFVPVRIRLVTPISAGRTVQPTTSHQGGIMKRKSKRAPHKLQLMISWSDSYYVKWIANLEKLLRKNPRTVRME